MTRILHLDSSARREGSVSRDASAAIVERLLSENPGAEVTYRDLAAGEPFLNDTWVGATFTPVDDRTPAQRAALAHSDALVAELQSADIVVIGMPIYNFGVPAVLKAWIDQVARAGVTFRYTENGPKGLLTGKRAIVAFASGGVSQGAPVDFASPYLAHALGFLGITDTEFVIAADVVAEEPLAA